MDPARAYASLVARAGRGAVPALVGALGLPRRAAAEAFGAAAGLVLAGLARHRRRRADDARAAAGVVEKYGRPADVDAPAIAVGAHLGRPAREARLGGLLGDAGPRATAWIATRTGAAADVVSRALAASAPIALGALKAAAGDERLEALLDRAGEAPLEAPERLAAEQGPAAAAFRAGRRAGRPAWLRWLP